MNNCPFVIFDLYSLVYDQDTQKRRFPGLEICHKHLAALSIPDLIYSYFTCRFDELQISLPTEISGTRGDSCELITCTINAKA